MTTVEQAETDLIARTRALIPSCASERRRQQPLDACLPENIRALQAAGSLKTVQARRNGGYGLGMHADLDTISSIAEGCGSTAWVSGVVHAHSWLLSHFPAQGQDDVYGADPDSVVAAVIGPPRVGDAALRRQPHALGLLAVRVGQRERLVAPARRSRARRERRRDRRG